ncbi:MAG: type II secretion system F family protein [Nitriliruptor sp.]|nr:MAG: type II secretion system F family protein [Nitriliruptor sp.]
MLTALEPSLVIALGLTLAFVALMLVGYVAIEAASQRRLVNRSLQSMQPSQLSGSDVRQQQLAVPAGRRLVLPTLERVSKRVLRFSPPAIIDRLDQELTYAGSPAGWDGQRLMAAKWLTGVGLGLLAVVVLPLSGFGLGGTVLAGLLGAVVGYYLPEWIVRSRAGRRQFEIRLALPDALDLMSITVEAGLSFDAALDRVSREMGGPLGDELYRVVQEMRLGKGRGEALRDLSGRTTVEELKAFVMAMVQAEIFGISVSRVLHVQADELRIKRRQFAEERAQKLPVKIVFPLILCIFPALFVVLLGPAAISIYESIILRN